MIDMISKPLSSAIIGCGFVAGGYDETPAPGVIQTHALAYRMCPETTLVAVADSDLDRARRFAGHWDVEHAYDDAQAMLAAHQPDIVSICSPDDTHEDYLRLCLAMPSVRGVWCEKPLSLSPDGCEELVEQFRQAGKSLLVNFQRNFTTAYRQLKGELTSGKYGVIQKVVVHYTKGVIHNGSHAMDLLVGWFGLPDSMHVLSTQVDYKRTDPTVDALLVFDGVSVYLLGFNEKNYSLFEIHLYTETSTLSLTEGGRKLRVKRVQKQSTASGHRELETSFDKDMGLNMAMLDALNSLVASIKGRCGLVDGKRALAGLRIMHQLAKQGMKRIGSES